MNGYGELRLRPGDLVRHKPSKRLGTVLEVNLTYGLVAKLVWADNGRSGRKYIEELEGISRAPTT